MTPADDAATRRLARVRRAHERLASISTRVQEAIIADALRRAGTGLPEDGYADFATNGDESNG